MFAKSLIFCIFAADYKELEEGGDSPLSDYDMIAKEDVVRLAEEQLALSACYLVDVTVDPDNRIVVEIDHDTAVGIDDCVALSRYIEERIDRDVEDYALEVGSSGIGSPFKHIRQYRKNTGNEVEVLLKSGIKLKGVLVSVDEQGITVKQANRINRKETGAGETDAQAAVKPAKQQGSKRQATVFEDVQYMYDEIKYTKNIIRFK